MSSWLQGMALGAHPVREEAVATSADVCVGCRCSPLVSFSTSAVLNPWCLAAV